MLIKVVQDPNEVLVVLPFSLDRRLPNCALEGCPNSSEVTTKSYALTDGVVPARQVAIRILRLIEVLSQFVVNLDKTDWTGFGIRLAREAEVVERQRSSFFRFCFLT